MVIRAPREVDALMKQGRAPGDQSMNCAPHFAKKHRADFAFHHDGHFFLDRAHAAAENAAEGKKRNHPFCRTLKMNGRNVNPNIRRVVAIPRGGSNACAEVTRLSKGKRAGGELRAETFHQL